MSHKRKHQHDDDDPAPAPAPTRDPARDPAQDPEVPGTVADDTTTGDDDIEDYGR